MKTVYFFACLALGLTGCTTSFDHAPNPGGWGEYGFTYDLNASPSPFIDTAYRPLTPSDLAAPLLVVVTNQTAPYVVYKTAPEIGVTQYAGETPASAYNAPNPAFYEAAGANRAAAGAAAAQPGTPAAAAAPGGYVYGGAGGTIIGPITNINQVVTNTPGTNGTNITGINTNNTGIVTNTTNAVVIGITNTNGFFAIQTNFFTNNVAGGTNGVLNEAAGAQSGTNSSGTQFAPQQLTPAERQGLTPQQQQQLQQFRQQQQIQQQQQLQQQQQIRRLQPQTMTPPDTTTPSGSVPTGSPNRALLNPTATPAPTAAPTTPAPAANGRASGNSQSAPANNSGGGGTATGGSSSGSSGSSGGGASHSSGGSSGGTSH